MEYKTEYIYFQVIKFIVVHFIDKINFSSKQSYTACF